MLRTLLLSLSLAAAALVAAPTPAAACGGKDCSKECPVGGGAATATAPKEIPAAHRATATFTVTGMSCGTCSQKVTAALMGVDGIGAAQVDHKAGQAVVTYDTTKVKPDAISKTITDLGFQATVAPASKG